MAPDLWLLYRDMLKSRLFEEGVARLWNDGLIFGEMHLGTGEEAIVAGVISHLKEGDALALDHRGTSAMLLRGVDPVSLLREFLGRRDGLCSGMGGHMHLFSPAHLAASSGIVGASGPAVAGFGLAANLLRPGTVAVAFFGEGAMNQGMLLESLNLAAAWQLPVLFVCKDDTWAITTRSAAVTGGDLAARARAFGIQATVGDGTDVEVVWHAARQAVERARAGGGPSFLHMSCAHFEGHMLGDALLRAVRQPHKQGLQVSGPLLRSAIKRQGASMSVRAEGIRIIADMMRSARADRHNRELDPLQVLRQRLEENEQQLQELEAEVFVEIETMFERALEGNQHRSGEQL